MSTSGAKAPAPATRRRRGHAWRAALLTLLAIAVGLSVEWVLLTGSTPGTVIAAVQGPPTPAPTPYVRYSRPGFQTGVVFPQFGADAYSASNRNYGIGLGEIREQTAARWLQLTVDLYQPSLTSLEIGAAPYTLTPRSLADGIAAAHAAGYRVFVAPLLTVGASEWSGSIPNRSYAVDATWFDAYWRAVQPYAEAAAQAGAEQFAIGTELFLMERAPTQLWTTLIDRIHAVYAGPLTYDMNFTSVDGGVWNWLRHPAITSVGVSEYFSLTDSPRRVPPEQVAALWRERVQAPLDAYAAAFGKPIIISEIGYRNSSDCLYQPYAKLTGAPSDPAEQAAAYNAAVQDSLDDPWITGIYFWAWSLPPYSPNWLPAARVLHRWYNSPEA
jgi:hypothetical protein